MRLIKTLLELQFRAVGSEYKVKKNPRHFFVVLVRLP